MGKIWKFNSLAEEALGRYQPRTLPRTSPVVSLHHHHCSFIPCGAHLAGLSFVLAHRRLAASPPLLFYLSFPLSIFLSQAKCTRKVELFGTAVSRDEKPRGNVQGIAFILLKMWPFFPFVFGTTSHSCLHNSIPTA